MLVTVFSKQKALKNVDFGKTKFFLLACLIFFNLLNRFSRYCVSSGYPASGTWQEKKGFGYLVCLFSCNLFHLFKLASELEFL